MCIRDIPRGALRMVRSGPYRTGDRNRDMRSAAGRHGPVAGAEFAAAPTDRCGGRPAAFVGRHHRPLSAGGRPAHRRGRRRTGGGGPHGRRAGRRRRGRERRAGRNLSRAGAL